MVPPNNASKWQMGFNSAFKWLMQFCLKWRFFGYNWQRITGTPVPTGITVGAEPTGPPRPLSSQFKAEVNMSPASLLWTATSAGNIPWALPVPLFGSASDMPKRATQVCNEMWSGRNFLKVTEIAPVFYTENFLQALYVLVGRVLRVKRCFCTQFEVCSSSVIRGWHKNRQFLSQRQPVNAAGCENLMKLMGRCWYCPRDFNKCKLFSNCIV